MRDLNRATDLRRTINIKPVTTCDRLQLFSITREPHPLMTKSIDPQQLSLRAGGLILPIRGQRVLLDFQLATLYGVETRALKQAV